MDAAALTLRQTLLSDFWKYLRSTVIVQIVVVVGGVIVVRFLGPADYGLWTALLLLPNYAQHLQLGTLSALNREIPLACGRGDLEGVARMQNAALGGVWMLAGLMGIGLFAYLVFGRERHEPVVLTGIAFMAGIVVLQPFLHYYDALFRSGHDFTTVSRLRLVKTLTDIPLAVVLVAGWGFLGRVLAGLASSLCSLGYSIRCLVVPVRPVWDPKVLRRLLWFGFPLLAVDALYGVVISLDRLVIAGLLDRTQLGYYGVGLMAVGFLLLIPGTASEILYPRYAERFGASGSVQALEAMVLGPLAILAIGMAVIVGAAVMLLPPLVAIVLPAYLPGVDAARIALVGAFFLCLVPGPGNFLHTLNKQAPLLIIYGVTLGLLTAVNLLILKGGHGIMGVALGTILGYALMATAVVAYVLRHFYGVGECAKRLAWLYLPGLLALAGVVALEWVWPFPGSIGGTALAQLAAKLVLYGLWGIGIAWAALRWWLDSGALRTARTLWKTDA